MKITIIGYGRMGKEIHQAAEERNHSIELIIDKNNIAEIEKAKTTDVVLEFSLPTTAQANIEYCIRAGIPVVSGTTGWLHKLAEMKKLSNELQSGFLYATNFSIGMNVFFLVNKYLAEIMNKIPNYEVEITETHHIKKLDKPSGTAITLAQQIIENIDRKTAWSFDKQNDETISVRSFREGEVTGNHQVEYISEFDAIQISHSATNRRGFALGAVLAAEFIANKKGFFDMNDVLNEFLRK